VIDRRVITALTMLAAGVAVVVMGLWGVSALTAPVGDKTGSADHGPTCAPQDQKITEYVTRSEVTVSVYNAGRRKGRAGATLAMLEAAGFKPGEIGNAPAGTKVRRAEVRTGNAEDPKAQLVAAALGKNTQIVVTDEAYGPGIDVFIGDKFGALDPAAVRKVKLKDPITSCG
jgi:hypothetical protein